MSEPMPSVASLQLEPGTLWEQVKQRTIAALAGGALQPIATDYVVIEEHGIAFIVRIMANLVRKEIAQQQQRQATAKTGKPINPFLPYDPNLFVTDLTATHLCLLNKFNVVDHHILIITRAFEAQTCWLNWQDFLALWLCLREMAGLGFYNAGAVAGASQPHKHLQLIPLTNDEIPMMPAITTAQFQDGIGRVPTFPFVHGLARLDLDPAIAPEQAATSLLAAYETLLKSVGLHPGKLEPGAQQTGAYNLLVTREWMLLVPRSQESYETIAINALGFAGALLVKTKEQLERLKQLGIFPVLQQVGIPCSIDRETLLQSLPQS